MDQRSITAFPQLHQQTTDVPIADLSVVWQLRSA
jgi:hypothetical protein